MSTLQFAETHNMIAFLEKPAESNGFQEIIDFLNANQIHYALTVNPTIYTSCIEQFWATAKAKTVNGERQLQALVDKKKVIITETSIRSDLHLEDAGGTDCLPTATIFEELARMGYEKPSQRLTFYKAFFSPQWKFLIHTITQCLSAKTTAWNKFSSTMASAIICLATNQKFNLSKYIFDAMGRSDDTEMFDTYAFIGDEVFAENDMTKKEHDVIPKEVSAAKTLTTAGIKIPVSIDAPFTITVSPPVITEVEITLAQTLAELKSAKSKVVIQEPVQSTVTTAPSTILKAKGITFRDAGETTTRTPTSVSSSSIKDKGKAKMVEPEVPLNKKDC
ncbi:hypothetical protein Tco_0862877 [Tanacetum coccineum]